MIQKALDIEDLTWMNVSATTGRHKYKIKADNVQTIRPSNLLPIEIKAHGDDSQNRRYITQSKHEEIIEAVKWVAQ